MLEARDLSVRRGGKTILDDVSIAMRPGEFLAVIGPNGAGKSTLISALAGTLSPDRGEVLLDDVPIAAHDATALARRRAVLPQQSELTFGFDVMDVVLMGRSPHFGITDREEDAHIAHEALIAAGIEHLRDRQYTTLSGGERQRVQLARVLAQIWSAQGGGQTRYLLLDEPTNNLDLTHQHHILARAKTMNAEGTSVFAILHEPNLAAFYADRVAILDRGRLVAEGKPHEVLTEARLSSLYGIDLRVVEHPERGCPQIFVA
ncbi:iron complex transport system ATP-binding protein [Parvibaculum indicum]|uniref:heme ABC transporter ATP-binding protein n=1 Tax=Parvibaculum indicum TaxID=562969 RepID=UPI001422FA11|nr:heme ABC transporter ATP-binding protein [Parvibaculum indicum]NIJ42550.1 iron complex transport system ATP-binding protein [Parvibaculum indicum]